MGAFEAGNVAATLLILRATELLQPAHSDTRATTIALGLYPAYNTAATIISIPAGRLVDRIGGRAVLVAGVAALALAYVGFAINTAHWWALAVWFVLAGLGIGCVETAEHATVATHAPEHIRGSAFGLLAAVQSFGNLAASGIAGILWAAISPTAAFIYIAVWVNLALIALATARSPRAEHAS